MLNDKGAIVAGGESGIGAAGARVVVTRYKEHHAAAKLREAIGGDERALAVQTDVADEGAMVRLFDGQDR